LPATTGSGRLYVIECSYAILIAVIVLSLDRPDWLNFMTLSVTLTALTEILRLPAGVVITPPKAKTVGLDPAREHRGLAVTVVPSHNFPLTTHCVPDRTVTVPETNHFPAVPCATDGPSKKMAPSFMVTSPLSELVRAPMETGAPEAFW